MGKLSAFVVGLVVLTGGRVVADDLIHIDAVCPLPYTYACHWFTSGTLVAYSDGQVWHFEDGPPRRQPEYERGCRIRQFSTYHDYNVYVLYEDDQIWIGDRTGGVLQLFWDAEKPNSRVVSFEADPAFDYMVVIAYDDGQVWAKDWNNPPMRRTDWERPVVPAEVMPPIVVPTPDRLSVLAVPNPVSHSCQFRIMLPPLGGTGSITLSITDAGGRVVRHLGERGSPKGDLTVEWDGRDDVGREAPSGVYVYRLEAGGAPVSGRLVLTR